MAREGRKSKGENVEWERRKGKGRKERKLNLDHATDS